MNITEAIKTISLHYNVEHNDVENLLKNTFGDNVSSKNINNSNKKSKNSDKASSSNSNNDDVEVILPFCGIINKDCCKGIVFNHGLYTQCTKKTISDFCGVCAKKKYGRIEDRLNVAKNKFVSKEGRKEVPYEKVMEKMGYTYEQVQNALRDKNLQFEIERPTKKEVKKGRGRPRKIIKDSDSEEEEPQKNTEQNEEKEEKERKDNTEEDEEIEVTKVNVNGIYYLKTDDDILLDINTHEPVGKLEDNKIVVW